MQTFVQVKLYGRALDLHFCYVGDINSEVLMVVKARHLHYFWFPGIRFYQFWQFVFGKVLISSFFRFIQTTSRHSDFWTENSYLTIYSWNRILLSHHKSRISYPFNPNDQSMLFSFATDGIHGQDCGFYSGVNDLVLIWGPIFITMQ